MLVLSRKKNQRVLLQIGEFTAEVMIVEIRGLAVRLGFKFPGEVKIVREELVEDEPEGPHDEVEIEVEIEPAELVPQR